jgi:hypothetical protein
MALFLSSRLDFRAPTVVRPVFGFRVFGWGLVLLSWVVFVRPEVLRLRPFGPSLRMTKGLRVLRLVIVFVRFTIGHGAGDASQRTRLKFYVLVFWF